MLAEKTMLVMTITPYLPGEIMLKKTLVAVVTVVGLAGLAQLILAKRS